MKKDWEYITSTDFVMDIPSTPITTEGLQPITKKDIDALREYLDKLEALKRDPGLGLTVEEVEDALDELNKTGKIPEKYAGRLTEDYISVYKDKSDPNKLIYGIKGAAFSKKWVELNSTYWPSIAKVLLPAIEDGSIKSKKIPALIEDLLPPLPLDVSNLPNVLITDKTLQYAVTPLRNEHAYIMPFSWAQLSFDYNEDGEIVINTQAQFEALEHAKNKKHKIKAAGIDQPLLRQLFAATMAAYLSNYGNSITVSVPAFAREMNIDIRSSTQDSISSHSGNDFFKKLHALEELKGVWENGTFYSVFHIDSYDSELNTLTFSSPWLFKIARELLSKPAAKKERADGSLLWKMTGFTSLQKPTINSARSKPTVEIIASLLAGLKQYGNTPEAKRHKKRTYEDPLLVEYRITFKTLIERIPLIRENLDACADSSHKTTLLQRYFCGSNFKKRLAAGKGNILDEYITEYTHIKEYYKDFKLLFNPPTANTLNQCITIQHHGINPDFKQENALVPLLHQAKESGEV